jgi:CHASE3 domain sensor protein
VKKQMRKRVITLLFLPIAVFVWIIGWAMLWAGARNEQETEQTQAETRTEDESITIIPMIPEKFEEHEA